MKRMRKLFAIVIAVVLMAMLLPGIAFAGEQDDAAEAQPPGEGAAFVPENDSETIVVDGGEPAPPQENGGQESTPTLQVGGTPAQEDTPIVTEWPPIPQEESADGPESPKEADLAGEQAVITAQATATAITQIMAATAPGVEMEAIRPQANEDEFLFLNNLPAPVTVKNGTPKTIAGLQLPDTVDIYVATSTGPHIDRPAKVEWDIEGITPAMYDPSVKTQQVFDVTGNAILPEDVVNPGNLSTAFTVQVTVEEAGPGAPVVATEALANGKVLVAYNAPLQATGSAPITFSATGLPSGLSVKQDPASSEWTISGVPLEAKEYTVTLYAENSDGIAGKNITLTVEENRLAMPIGFVGIFYNAMLPSPYVAPYVTNLPDGLSLDGNNIKGTPTTAGQYPLVNNSAAPINLLIVQPVSITTSALPNGNVGNAYSFTVESAGEDARAYTATGLPAGLSMSANGVISGTPTQQGSFSISVTAKDSYSEDVKKYTLTIAQEGDSDFQQAIDAIQKITKLQPDSEGYRQVIDTAWGGEGQVQPDGTIKFELQDTLGSLLPEAALGVKLTDENGAPLTANKIDIYQSFIDEYQEAGIEELGWQPEGDTYTLDGDTGKMPVLLEIGAILDGKFTLFEKQKDIPGNAQLAIGLIFPRLISTEPEDVDIPFITEWDNKVVALENIRLRLENDMQTINDTIKPVDATKAPVIEAGADLEDIVITLGEGITFKTDLEMGDKMYIKKIRTSSKYPKADYFTGNLQDFYADLISQEDYKTSIIDVTFSASSPERIQKYYESLTLSLDEGVVDAIVLDCGAYIKDTAQVYKTKKKTKFVPIVGAGVRYELSPDIFGTLNYKYQFNTKIVESKKSGDIEVKNLDHKITIGVGFRF
ncbi:hypothetical protein LJC56_11790 [Christensenellaceae bacterium OttesenSCG-928-K19]|nr:hypothetical protein [Christensenellaceae bacterium OttesenSCG-928-K19]